MFDYYNHVCNMDENKLTDELKRLNNQLMVTNPASPLYNQILGMMDMANSAYTDIVYNARFKDAKDEALNIGSITSDVNEIDYTREELLDAVVTQYITKPSDRKKK